MDNKYCDLLLKITPSDSIAKIKILRSSPIIKNQQDNVCMHTIITYLCQL